jgi:hypothetical protein
VLHRLVANSSMPSSAWTFPQLLQKCCIQRCRLIGSIGFILSNEIRARQRVGEGSSGSVDQAVSQSASTGVRCLPVGTVVPYDLWPGNQGHGLEGLFDSDIYW